MSDAAAGEIDATKTTVKYTLGTRKGGGSSLLGDSKLQYSHDVGHMSMHADVSMAVTKDNLTSVNRSVQITCIAM